MNYRSKFATSETDINSLKSLDSQGLDCTPETDINSLVSYELQEVNCKPEIDINSLMSHESQEIDCKPDTEINSLMAHELQAMDCKQVTKNKPSLLQDFQRHISSSMDQIEDFRLLQLSHIDHNYARVLDQAPVTTYGNANMETQHRNCSKGLQQKQQLKSMHRCSEVSEKYNIQGLECTDCYSDVLCLDIEPQLHCTHVCENESSNDIIKHSESISSCTEVSQEIKDPLKSGKYLSEMSQELDSRSFCSKASQTEAHLGSECFQNFDETSQGNYQCLEPVHGNIELAQGIQQELESLHGHSEASQDIQQELESLHGHSEASQDIRQELESQHGHSEVSEDLQQVLESEPNYIKVLQDTKQNLENELGYIEVKQDNQQDLKSKPGYIEVPQDNQQNLDTKSGYSEVLQDSQQGLKFKLAYNEVAQVNQQHLESKPGNREVQQDSQQELESKPGYIDLTQDSFQDLESKSGYSKIPQDNQHVLAFKSSYIKIQQEVESKLGYSEVQQGIQLKSLHVYSEVSKELTDNSDTYSRSNDYYADCIEKSANVFDLCTIFEDISDTRSKLSDISETSSNLTYISDTDNKSTQVIDTNKKSAYVFDTHKNSEVVSCTYKDSEDVPDNMSPIGADIDTKLTFVSEAEKISAKSYFLSDNDKQADIVSDTAEQSLNVSDMTEQSADVSDTAKQSIHVSDSYEQSAGVFVTDEKSVVISNILNKPASLGHSVSTFNSESATDFITWKTSAEWISESMVDSGINKTSAECMKISESLVDSDVDKTSAECMKISESLVDSGVDKTSAECMKISESLVDSGVDKTSAECMKISESLVDSGVDKTSAECMKISESLVDSGADKSSAECMKISESLVDSGVDKTSAEGMKKSESQLYPSVFHASTESIKKSESLVDPVVRKTSTECMKSELQVDSDTTKKQSRSTVLGSKNAGDNSDSLFSTENYMVSASRNSLYKTFNKYSKSSVNGPRNYPANLLCGDYNQTYSDTNLRTLHNFDYGNYNQAQELDSRGLEKSTDIQNYDPYFDGFCENMNRCIEPDHVGPGSRNLCKSFDQICADINLKTESANSETCSDDVCLSETINLYEKFNSDIDMESGEKCCDFDNIVNSCRDCHQDLNQTSALYVYQHIQTFEKLVKCYDCHKMFSTALTHYDTERRLPLPIQYSIKINNSEKIKARMLKNKMKNLIRQRQFFRLEGIRTKNKYYTSKNFRVAHELHHHTRIESVNTDTETPSGERLYKCDVCFRKYIQPGYLRRHMETHAWTECFQCGICKKQCNGLGALGRHRKIHSELDIDRNFKMALQNEHPTCKICNLQSTGLGSLKEHKEINTKMDKEPSVVDTSDKRKIEVCCVEKHIGRRRETEFFECEICEKQCKGPGALGRHRKVHFQIDTGQRFKKDEPKKYSQCKICRLQHKGPGTLKGHNEINFKTKRESPLVGTSNKRKPKMCYLDQTLFTHRKMECFQCEICGKQCKGDAALEKHRKIHFSLDIGQHLKIDMQKELSQCTICKYKRSDTETLIINSKFDLETSLINTSGKRKTKSDCQEQHITAECFPCDVCEKQCKSAGALGRHRKIHCQLDIRQHLKKDPDAEFKTCNLTLPDTGEQKKGNQAYPEINHGKTDNSSVSSSSGKRKADYADSVITDAKVKKLSHTDQFCKKDPLSHSHALKAAHAHEQKKMATCKECAKTFASLSQLRVHETCHSDYRPYTCGICNKTFNLAFHICKHVKGHPEESFFKCTECHKRFSQFDILKKHVVSCHDNTKRYKCRKCESYFSDAFGVNTHMELEHSRKDRYVCGICGKYFALACHLCVHALHHKDRMVYKCGICDEEFILFLQLKLHQRQHNEGKHYCCNLCNKTFTYPWNLQSHRKSQHRNKKDELVCHICNYEFTRHSSLLKHNTFFHAR